MKRRFFGGREGVRVVSDEAAGEASEAPPSGPRARRGPSTKPADAPDGVKDLGLRRLRQADGLGVGAALDVEHAAVAPAVLVVADERALRVGRQRRLACARVEGRVRGLLGEVGWA
jgi:hypothetical protein